MKTEYCYVFLEKRVGFKVRNVAKKILWGVSLWGAVFSGFADDSLSNILSESQNVLSQQLPVVKATANNVKSQVSSKTLPNTNVGVAPKSAHVVSDDNNQFRNLDMIDKDSNDLNQLNRKLQVEKVEAEIRKFKTNGTSSRGGDSNNSTNENAQTIVTGIAINAMGKKIAWLQFADGGTLTVNVGSSVGKYKVVDIGMTGVTIGEEVGFKKHKSMKTIFLKRVYASSIPSKKQKSNKNNFYFTPSPVVTGANSKSDYVPPIIPLN